MKKNIYNLCIIILLIVLITLISFCFFRNKDLESRIKTLESSIIKQFNELEELGEKISKLRKQILILGNSIENQENSSNIEVTKNKTEFENPPTDGLTPISESEAKVIWEEYRKEIICKEDDNYVIEKITIEDVIPNNHISYNYSEGKEKDKVADFTRKAYVFYCNLDNTSDHVEGYVDMYTGKVIGGVISGL